ncbi:MAG: alpha/beta hydrolase [Rhodospirillales bacterium]|nr:alpha/beta hydrolase [Rhodospirillales bacterium]
MSGGSDYLFDGPDKGPLFIFAHGAGGPMDSPFMETFAQGLGNKGIRVARFEFPYMAKRRSTGKKRPPDRAPVLQSTWRTVITGLGGPECLVIGGKSMGGRIASMVAAELQAEGTPVRGLACLGYPFHAAGRSDMVRIDHFAGFETPALILQGARDSMGWYDEVSQYPLPPSVGFHWLDDGDHDFKPRVLSGRTMRQNHDEAIDALAAFILGLG